jgi:large subunit ribosomal protein L13
MSLTKQTASLRAQDVPHQWYVIDLKDKVLGRAAVRIADLLRGKGKPSFTANGDTGDFVVVVNASSVCLTGKKMDKKMYRHHTLHIGGLKSAPARIYLQRHSTEAVRQAVWGMLPKGALGRRLIHHLKVYAGAEHPHAAQNPQPFAL